MTAYVISEVEILDEARAREWYGSPEYAEALKMRHGALARTPAFVEGAG